MKRAVGYARYSSEMQDDNTIEAQSAAIGAYAQKNDYELVDTISDRAESGRTDSRENFVTIYNKIRSGALKVDAVLIYKMARFFRNVHLWAVYENRLEMMGVKIISVSEPLPENEPLAQLQKTMIRAFDEFTSDNIGVLSRDGTKQVVKNGYWSRGPAPTGYKNAQIPSREGHARKGVPVMRGILVRDERLAAIVIRAFEITAETGKGGNQIYKQLVLENSGPVLGPHGRPLGPKGINAILKNPIYKGTVIYNNYGYRTLAGDLAVDGGKSRQKRYAKPESEWVVRQNEDWRLVSDELWEAAQRARAANQRAGFGHGNKRAAYALTGLGVCGVCGRNCGGHWQESKNPGFSENSRYYYYRCREAMNGSMLCSNKSKIRGKVLESAILDELLHRVLDERLITEIAEEVIARRKKAAENATDISMLIVRREQLVSEQQRLITLAAQVRQEIGALAQKLKDLEREIQQIDLRIAASKKPQTSLTIAELKPVIRRNLAHARELFRTDLDVDDLRCLLKKWIDAIRIDADGRVFVKWKSSAIFELLELPASEMESEGSLQRHFGHSPIALGSWNPLPMAGSKSAVSVLDCSRLCAAPASSGFSGAICDSSYGVPAWSGFSGMIGAPPRSQQINSLLRVSAASRDGLRFQRHSRGVAREEKDDQE
ncbi:MAG TPA: recombinase family protein [Planctomycetota bacterium]|jgi:site-specific DNA recombinase